MPRVQSTCISLPFCNNNASEHTDLSANIRITVIALGAIAAIVGLLTLLNVPVFNRLGTTFGECAFILGDLAVFLGLNCAKSRSKYKEYPNNEPSGSDGLTDANIEAFAHLDASRVRNRSSPEVLFEQEPIGSDGLTDSQRNVFDRIDAKFKKFEESNREHRELSEEIEKIINNLDKIRSKYFYAELDKKKIEDHTQFISVKQEYDEFKSHFEKKMHLLVDWQIENLLSSQKTAEKEIKKINKFIDSV